MKSKDFQNLTSMFIINQSGGSIRKNPKKLIRSIYKFAKFKIEINSIVNKPFIYNEVINNTVYKSK